MSTALASIAAISAAFALRRGMTMEEVEEHSGVPGLDLVRPDVRVPDRAVASLWRALGDAEPEAVVALELARAAPLSILGGLAHGAQFAANLGEALGLLVANRAVLAERLSARLEPAGADVAVLVSHPLDELDGGRLNELALGLIWRYVGEVAAEPIRPVRVEFSRERHGPGPAYADFFDCEVRFRSSRNALVFRADDLRTKTSQASLELFALVEEHFRRVRERLEHESVPQDLAPLHRAVAECAARGDFDALTVAAAAGMSLRTAQRIARAGETSLSALIRTRRIELARELLLDPRASVAGVARLVGYAEERSFRRAFADWTGQTPAGFRRSRGGAR
ncbi:MAG: AraC family transcriptional regulator ligand-binding domain-containing protein [Planctomycetota bacterium]